MARVAGCVGFLVVSACPGAESAPAGTAAVAEYAPLAIRLGNRFYNRPSGFRVKEGRLTFMHIEGSASLAVVGITDKELSQFPATLRAQIAAEVVAEGKRREETERLAKEGKLPAASGAGAARRGGGAGRVGKLAGPNGSLRYIPVEPAGGGDVEVQKVSPKGGGAVDGRPVDAGDPIGSAPWVSAQVTAAVESHGRVVQSVAANDVGGAVAHLSLLAEIPAPSRDDGKYIDNTVIDASFRVLEHALSINDPVAGEDAALVVSRVGGTRPEVVTFLQGAFNQVCLMADRAQFRDVALWMRSLECLGPSYGIALELGRHRVARRVLKAGFAELRDLRLRNAWEAYVLSKELWVDNPDLGPIGLMMGLGGAVALALMTWIIWKSVDAFRDSRTGRASISQRRAGAAGTVAWRPVPSGPRRPTSGPRPPRRGSRE